MRVSVLGLMALVVCFGLLTGCGNSGGSSKSASGGAAPAPPPPPPPPSAPPGAPPAAEPMADAPPAEPTPTPGEPSENPPPEDKPEPKPEPQPEPTPPSDPPPEGDPNNPDQPMVAKPLTIFEQAAEQYRLGNDTGAMTLLQMHYVTDGAKDIANDVRWVPALKRPTAVVRWGIGVVYTAPPTYFGNPRPIGTSNPDAGKVRNAGEFRRDRGQREQPQQDGVGDNGAAAMPTDASGIFRSYTGDTGTLVLAELEKRIQEKMLGNVLAAAVDRKSAENPEGNPPADAAAQDGAEGKIDPALLNFLVKTVGKDGRIDMRRLPQEVAQMDPKVLLALVRKKQAASAEVKPILPGVSFLGLGAVAELEKRAKAQGVDVLLLYSVDVRPATGANIVNNTTRFRLTVLASGEKLFDSQAHNNLKVQEEREKGTANDPVAADVEKMFAIVDQRLKPTDLPAGLTPEIVKRRITSLAGEGLPKLLPNMLEMRLYQAKGLVTEAELLEIAKEALGADALQTLTQAMAGGDANVGKIGEFIEKAAKQLGDAEEKAPLPAPIEEK